MKLKIKVSDDELSKVLCKTLKTLHKSICNTYTHKMVGDKRNFTTIFSTDFNEEIEKLEQFIEAIALVHNYYCYPAERISFEDSSNSRLPD